MAEAQKMVVVSGINMQRNGQGVDIALNQMGHNILTSLTINY